MPLSQTAQSHIHDHVISCNSNQISLDHFSIIDTNKNICALGILESFNIFQIKPQLNRMQSAYPISIVRKFVLVIPLFICSIITIRYIYKYVIFYG